MFLQHGAEYSRHASIKKLAGLEDWTRSFPPAIFPDAIFLASTKFVFRSRGEVAPTLRAPNKAKGPAAIPLAKP